ncbi:pyruvate, phosphate dikinase [Nocardioides immobilis]|uniref:Pyruvate, phosphate dikinase n=2 Tax=Nocardioides immobilis TaxID=2049295 RepID=A0A417XWC0_9ACTN|nr:pyruvate, phosphate dikinase [Nocardioides immobilis]
MAAGVPVGVVRLDGTCTLGRTAIGGKAWSVNAMRALGLSVPPAVALTTGSCAAFYAAGGQLTDELWDEVRRGIEFLETETGRRFGGEHRPLLISVRSGAPVSMPGMMDTVLNLGLSRTAAEALVAETGDEAYVADTLDRFRRQYRETVLDNRLDPGLDKGLDQISGAVPDDPWEQLAGAVTAVFGSWQSARARAYRESFGIADDLGTSVTLQAMVFGNLDDRSGTGVLFSRNPSTGEPVPFGEWLPRGQGEDVVSGRVTPLPLSALAGSHPEVHAELLRATAALEVAGGDVQDIEFTVEAGRLWLLQSRAAKRSAGAAVRIAVDLVDEGVLAPAQAVLRVTADQVRAVAGATAGSGVGDPVAAGEAACPGFATGIAVTDPDEAEERADAGEDVVLVRATTSPDDFHGMLAAVGIVTEYGGATSHAAVVSREIGRPCVVGCGAGTLDRLAGHEVTVDGSTGRVWLGRLVAQDATADRHLVRLAALVTADLPEAERDWLLAQPLGEWLPDRVEADRCSPTERGALPRCRDQ